MISLLKQKVTEDSSTLTFLYKIILHREEGTQFCRICIPKNLVGFTFLTNPPPLDPLEKPILPVAH